MNNFDGMYIGKVISNTDELQRERVFCRIIGVHDMSNENSNNGVWCEYAIGIPYVSGRIPEVDSYVYLMFLKDINNKPDTQKAIYLGVVRFNVE